MSMKTIRKVMSTDNEFTARFCVNPKKTLEEYGIKLSNLDETDINSLEVVVRQTQENVATNLKFIGAEVPLAAWGIGAGCCNSKIISAATFRSK